ncbi:MAG: tetratricopeptide repeat protein [Candidatus Moraniibacteriota bacterium]
MEFKNLEKKVPIGYGGLNHSGHSAFELHKRNQTEQQPPVAKSEAQPDNKKSTTRVLDFMMSLSFGALFFGLPLFFLNNTFQGIIFEKQIYFYFWVLVAVISWLTKSIIVGELKIKETPLDYFIGGFAVAYALSTFFSVDRWHSFFGFFGDQSRGFINVLACILIYYFIVSNFSKKRLTIALSSIIASSIILQIWTMIGLFFAAKLPGWITSHVPASLFGSVTSLGIFLSLVYPLFIITIYKLLESKLVNKIKITLTVLVGLFFVVDIVLMWFLWSFIFLPSVFPGLIVGVSFFVIFVIALIVKPAPGWSWLTFFSFMAVMLLLMIGSGEGYLPQRLPSEVSPGYPLSWTVAKDAMKDKFFLGTGAASYGYDFSKYRSQDLNNTQFFDLRFYQGSGLFFEALPTIGFLGTVVGLLILLSYLGTSVFLLSKEKEKNKMYSLGFFSSGIIFLYSALTMRVDGSILIFGILVTILSVAVLQFESSDEGQYRALSLKTSPKYALALAFIFMLASGAVVYVFVFMGKSLVADIYMRNAVTKAASSQEDSIKQIGKAILLYPNEGRYFARAGQAYMVLANNEALKGKDKQDTNLIQADLNYAIALSTKAKDLTPYDVATVEGLAQVYENSTMYVDKSVDLAAQYYQGALDLEPHNPAYFVKLGQMKIAKASSTQDNAQKKQFVQESIDLFQKSVDEKKDYAIGYYYLAIAGQANGDLDKAIENITNSVIIERNNANYLFTLANFLRERGKNDDYANAEKAYKEIIGQDDGQYNVHLALGLLYEKQKKNDAAIAEYKKVLTVLPQGSDDAKTQVTKMITNVQNGTGNLQSATQASAAQPAAQNSGQNVPVPSPAQPPVSQSVPAQANPQPEVQAVPPVGPVDNAR